MWHASWQCCTDICAGSSEREDVTWGQGSRIKVHKEKNVHKPQPCFYYDINDTIPY